MAILDIERADHSVVRCDTEKHMLTYMHYHIKFTPVEWKIIKKLYENRPKFIKREELIELIWDSKSNKRKYSKLKKEGKKYPTRVIDAHISSIRKKLEYIKGAKIDSLYGYGYRFLLIERF